jgi:hypothetical protein
MKNSINNLRNTLSNRELLSTQHLCLIKGGDGEDIRDKKCSPPTSPPPPKPTATPCTTGA